MRRLLAPLLVVLVAVVLSVLTQVGGVVLIVAAIAAKMLRRGALVTILIFMFAYGAASTLVVPPLAALGGRVPLPCFGEVLRTLPLVCVLNRHYVTPRLAEMASALATSLADEFPGTVTVALDANFPFIDGAPLLPHLSHDDGRKLDLAYAYASADGTYLAGVTRSPIGYWAFEQPGPGEETDCPPVSATARWDLDWLQPVMPDLPLDSVRTRATLEWLSRSGGKYGLERVFVEPYLAKRLGVSSPVLGFQGCRAARHDDHIHVQIDR